LKKLQEFYFNNYGWYGELGSLQVGLKLLYSSLFDLEYLHTADIVVTERDMMRFTEEN
jgi:hypothetical protein